MSHMLSKVRVAVVQQEMKSYREMEGYWDEVCRLMDTAAKADADIVIFPALSPMMIVDALLSPEESSEEEQQDEERQQFSAMIDRMFRRSESPKAGQNLRLRRRLSRLLTDKPAALYDGYVGIFSAAALKYKRHIVAGSLYMRADEASGVKHSSYVFDPDGQIIGCQEKVHLTAHEMRFCQSGDSFRPIKTDFGTLGILIGEDVLYPEAARILAYRGIDAIINLAACAGQSRLTRIRRGFIARVDENELVGAQSYLVGKNSMTPDGMPFVGKSSVRTPPAMTPHSEGLVDEASSEDGEDVVVGDWDFIYLREYWNDEEPRLRQSMRVISYKHLAEMYESGRTLDQVYTLLQEEPREAADEPPGKPRDSKADSRVDFGKAGKELGVDLLSSPFSTRKLKDGGQEEEEEQN
jgi:predicted amidohydrolase